MVRGRRPDRARRRRGPASCAGPQGVQGPKGPAGPEGAAGSARAYVAVHPPVASTFNIDDKKNVVGVRREPGTVAGRFCVRVDPSSGLLPDGDNLAVVASASEPAFTANSRPWVGNNCDDDEMVVATYNAAGNLADSGFSAVLP